LVFHSRFSDLNDYLFLQYTEDYKKHEEEYGTIEEFIFGRHCGVEIKMGGHTVDLTFDIGLGNYKENEKRARDNEVVLWILTGDEEFDWYRDEELQKLVELMNDFNDSLQDFSNSQII
jgi:hypothetical protein